MEFHLEVNDYVYSKVHDVLLCRGGAVTLIIKGICLELESRERKVGFMQAGESSVPLHASYPLQLVPALLIVF